MTVVRGRARSSCASAARESRSTTCTSPGGGSSGSPRCGHHRLRFAHGRDVHRPAVPAERARLLDIPRRLAILPAAFAMVLVRAAVGTARARPRLALHAAPRLPVLPARLPHDAAAAGGGRAVLEVGLGTRSRHRHRLFGTPASHSLTGSVPVARAGMASGTADLQRDLGGAIMQSIFGALLTAGYAAAVSAAIGGARQARRSPPACRPSSTKSFPSAANVASSTRSTRRRSPPRPRSSFLDGRRLAYGAGAIAVVTVPWSSSSAFPRRPKRIELLEHYQERRQRTGRAVERPASAGPSAVGYAQSVSARRGTRPTRVHSAPRHERDEQGGHMGADNRRDPAAGHRYRHQPATDHRLIHSTLRSRRRRAPTWPRLSRRLVAGLTASWRSLCSSLRTRPACRHRAARRRPRARSTAFGLLFLCSPGSSSPASFRRHGAEVRVMP